VELEKQGYKFEFDDPPALKKIIGHDQHISDQYWKRLYNYTDEQFSHLSYEQQTEIAEVEDLRCREGLWIMLKGKPFWIPPDAYHWLTFWTIDGRHPDFILNQMHDFYFYRHCELDDHCFGSIEFKPRREGCTHRKLSCFMNKARGVYDKWFGIISKTGDDAKDANFGNLVKGYARYPYWMKPMVNGVFPPKTTLEFAQPAQRAGKGDQRLIQSLGSDSLNTKIDWANTSETAYDGYKLYRLIIDEFAKITKADAYKMWITHKLCLVDGYDIIGKAYLLSTIEGDDDKETSADSIANFVKIWRESNANERDMMGRTSSGLYRWFIPFHLSVRGQSPRTMLPLVNKYGEVDEIEAKKLRQIEVDSKKNPRDKLKVIRQKPCNVQEALTTMGGSATFDNLRWGKRLDYLRNEFVPSEQRPVIYRTGNLFWANNEKFSKVVFRDDTEGKFRIAYFPEIAGFEMTNNVKVLDNGTFAPFGMTQFVMGIDPFDYDAVQDGEGSKGSFLVFLKNNFANPKLSNIYCLEYLHREESAMMFYEDIYKAMFFYGAKLQIERKNYGLFRDMKNKRLTSFIMNRPEVTKFSKYTQGDNDLGTPTGTEIIKIGCELIENRFAPPNPETNENEKDNMEYFWFDRTIEQLMAFDKSQSTKFDAVMAMIHTELGSQSLKKYNPNVNTIKSENGKSPIDYLFPIRQGNQVLTHEQYYGQNKHRIA